MDEHHDEIIRLDMQVKRLVSDADSEKDTRKCANQHIADRFDKVNDRLDKHERWFAVGMGGGAVLIFLIELVFKR